MPARPVVSNNTPLIALWILNRLDLLQELFGEILIPEGVRDEFLATESAQRQAALDRSPWIRIAALGEPRRALVYVGLDKGEAAVLALAEEQNARLVIIDELRGRRYARRLGLPLTGTMGLLLLGKERGLLPAVAPLIQTLLESGLHLHPDLISRVLELAGERPD